jgi:hypothetical protein
VWVVDNHSLVVLLKEKEDPQMQFSDASWSKKAFKMDLHSEE